MLDHQRGGIDPDQLANQERAIADVQRSTVNTENGNSLRVLRYSKTMLTLIYGVALLLGHKAYNFLFPWQLEVPDLETAATIVSTYPYISTTFAGLVVAMFVQHRKYIALNPGRTMSSYGRYFCIMLGVSVIFHLVIEWQQRMDQMESDRDEIRRYCYYLRYQQLEKNLPPYATLDPEISASFMVHCIQRTRGY